MVDLQYIMDQWSADSQLNSNDLARVSVDTAILHAKYMQWFVEAKLKLKQEESKQKILLKDKWLYYGGKMDREQMDEKGWDYDPLGGLKVMKGDMNHFYESDPDIQKSEQRIHYWKTMVETLAGIIDVLKWRHQTVRNIIDWKRFEAGS